MYLIKILTSIVLLSIGTLAHENSLNERKPNSEDYTAHFGSIQVNASKDETSSLFVRGDAAKAIYQAMRDVLATKVNAKNIIERKLGTHVTCNHLAKSDIGASNDGYECFFDLNASGGFVN